MRCTIADKEKINRVMRDDSVYPFSVGYSKKCTTKYPVSDSFIRDERAIILSPHDDIIFIFTEYSNIMCIGHSSIMEGARGKIGIESAKKACQWLFDNTKYKKIIGFTPETYRSAIMFSLKVGFKKEGLIEKSFESGNGMCGNIIFGMSKSMGGIL